MAMQFRTPDDIRRFGDILRPFAERAKQFNDALEGFGFPDAIRQSAVGDGWYNSWQKNELDGDEIRQARLEGRRSGIYGLFQVAHRPHLLTALLAPLVLGKKGCRLQITRGDRHYYCPLDRVAFDFTTRWRRNAGKAGQITLGLNTRFESESGESITLPAGTTLTAPTNSMVADRLEWDTQRIEGQNHTLCILDPSGKPMHRESAIRMLWGHVGGKGKNELGVESRRAETLAEDGIDDMETAEGHLIDYMNGFIEHNGIDLTPEFAAHFKKSCESLQTNPELLAALALCMEPKQFIQPHEGLPRLDGSPTAHVLFNHYHALQYAYLPIKQLVKAMDLKLPDLTDSLLLAQMREGAKALQQGYEAKVGQAVIEHENDGKMYTLKRAIMHRDALSPDWLTGCPRELVGDVPDLSESELNGAVLPLLSEENAQGGLRSAHHALDDARVRLECDIRDLRRSDCRPQVQKLVTILGAITNKLDDPALPNIRKQVGRMKEVLAELAAAPATDGIHAWGSFTTRLPKLQNFVALMEHHDGSLKKLRAMYADVSFVPGLLVSSPRLDGEPIRLGRTAGLLQRVTQQPAQSGDVARS